MSFAIKASANGASYFRPSSSVADEEVAGTCAGAEDCWRRSSKPTPLAMLGDIYCGIVTVPELKGNYLSSDQELSFNFEIGFYEAVNFCLFRTETRNGLVCTEIKMS